MSSINPFSTSAVGEYNTERTIRNTNLNHMALCFVLDKSGSMVGEPIRALNDGMNRFKEMALRDSDARDILDVAIIEFDHNFRILQNFLPVGEMMHVSLSTDRGGTCFAPPMYEAIRMVKDRTKFYKDKYADPYKPWIVLITDGKREPEHETEHDFNGVCEALRGQQTGGKLAVRSLGVKGYDSRTLHLLSDYQRTDGKPGWYKNVLQLHGYDFTGFFNWVMKSMAAISQNPVSEPPPPAPLQQDGSVTVDLYDLGSMG